MSGYGKLFVLREIFFLTEEEEIVNELAVNK